MINYPKILLSLSVKAAKNLCFYKFLLRKGSLFCERMRLNF